MGEVAVHVEHKVGCCNVLTANYMSGVGDSEEVLLYEVRKAKLAILLKETKIYQTFKYLSVCLSTKKYIQVNASGYDGCHRNST